MESAKKLITASLGKWNVHMSTTLWTVEILKGVTNTDERVDAAW